MKNTLKTIVDFFKSKNVELQADELANLSDSLINDSKPAVTMPQQPDFVHNQKIFEDYKADTAKLIAEIQKKNEERENVLKSELEKITNYFVEMKTAKETTEKALQEQAAKTQAEKIKTVIEEMKSKGKIPAQNDDLANKYQKMLENDFETAKTIIDALPATTNESKPSVTVAGQTSNPKTKLGMMGRSVDPKIMDNILQQVEITRD